jgi:hypothetical protein
LVKLRFIKKVNIRMETHGNLKRKIIWILRRIKYARVSQSDIDEKFCRMCSQYDPYQSPNLLSTDEWLDRQVLDAGILDTVLLETEDGPYRVAACYRELLQKMYGNYGEYLPVSQRIQEVVKSYNRLSYFSGLKQNGR